MNEHWASEVERQLRTIQSRLTSLNQNDLRLQGIANFGLPVTVPPTGSDEDEIYWIRLTSKTVIAGVNVYEWRRQVYVMTGGGMTWVDTGEAGTLAENPAVGLNNEDRSTTDGKRYPAKYNPDTAQWIFFLTLSSGGSSPPGYTDPPGPGDPYPFGWNSLHVTADYDTAIEISPDKFIDGWATSFNYELQAANGARRQLYWPSSSGVLNLSGVSGPSGTNGPTSAILHYTNGYYSTAPTPPFGSGSYANSSPLIICSTMDGTWDHSSLSFNIGGISESSVFTEMGKIHVGLAGNTWASGSVTGKCGFNVLPNDPIPYDGYNPFCYYGKTGSVTVDATLYIWVKNNLGIDLVIDEYPATLTYEWAS